MYFNFLPFRYFYYFFYPDGIQTGVNVHMHSRLLSINYECLLLCDRMPVTVTMQRYSQTKLHIVCTQHTNIV